MAARFLFELSRRGSWGLAATLSLLACDETAPPAEPGAAPLMATASASAATPRNLAMMLPARRPVDTNPLNLPGMTVKVEQDARVYAVPGDVLQGAKEGSTLVLRAASVDGYDGANLILRQLRGQPYPIHPGYIVVPPKGGAFWRYRRGAPVIATYRRQLRHGVVIAPRADRVIIRYTDLGVRLPDIGLSERELAPQREGLHPGNYAVRRAAHDYEHVLLVSSAVHPDGRTRWLTLGHVGEARLFDEAELTAVPLAFKPKAGDSVWVAWRGKMVGGVVKSVEDPGLYQVKRPRAGFPLTVGPGQLMKPLGAGR